MNKFTTIILLAIIMLGCARSPQSNNKIPIHDSFTIVSKHLGENRVINVWTPRIYKENNISLPIIYMPDGGVKEDFPHIANTISRLIDNKSIPPFILVGIENTNRRRDLTGASQSEEDAEHCPVTDGAANFRAFIKDELFLKIDKEYCTTNYKGIIGESLAGLFIMETFFIAPNTFDFYIAMDPSLWWNNHSLVNNSKKTLATLPNKNIKLWFAGSSASDISKYTNQLETVLQDNAPKNLIWKYCNEPKLKHYTIYRATKRKALIWTLGN